MEWPFTGCITHLGVDRYTSYPRFIEDLISLARRTAYSLFGAGFHGLNGLPPLVCKKICQLYVLPCLIFGLEAMKLSKNNISKLEKFHLTMVR